MGLVQPSRTTLRGSRVETVQNLSEGDGFERCVENRDFFFVLRSNGRTNAALTEIPA